MASGKKKSKVAALVIPPSIDLLEGPFLTAVVKNGSSIDQWYCVEIPPNVHDDLITRRASWIKDKQSAEHHIKIADSRRAEFEAAKCKAFGNGTPVAYEVARDPANLVPRLRRPKRPAVAERGSEESE